LTSDVPYFQFVLPVRQYKVIDKSFENLAKYVNAYEQKMYMKREAIANKGIWVAKKRYMMNVFDEEGVRYDIPKLKIMGVEAVKSSTPEVCRGKIKDAIRVIMNQNEDDLVKFVNAVANKKRLIIINILKKKDRCVCELEAVLDESQPAISHHLKILENAGLIRGWKKGKFTHYDIVNEQIISYLNTLNQKLT